MFSLEKESNRDVLLLPTTTSWEGTKDDKAWHTLEVLQARVRVNEHKHEHGKLQLDKSCFVLSFKPQVWSNYDRVLERLCDPHPSKYSKLN